VPSTQEGSPNPAIQDREQLNLTALTNNPEQMQAKASTHLTKQTYTSLK